MKIAFIAQDLCGQGAQASTAAMAREFYRQGFAVDILISPVHDKKVMMGAYPFPLPEGITVIKMPSLHARGNIFFLRSYLKHSGVDVAISTSGPYHKCHALAKVCLKKRQIIHVMMDHGNWFGHGHKWWGDFVYCGFDRHFFVNTPSRDNFLKQYPKYDIHNTHVVYNPCVDELFLSKLNKQPSHPWLREKAAPTFITAGAFYPYKHHMVMLKAMSEIHGKSNARLILFGGGPLEDVYHEYIKAHSLQDTVSIGGYAENLPSEMGAADGYLMSSDTESFGIVIVEALAAGLHVISTDALYGPREILANGKYGDLVPIGDYKAMAAKILAFAKEEKKPTPPESWNRFTEAAVFKYFMKGLRLSV